MADGLLVVAAADIAAAIRRYRLAGMLGWQDVAQRYRRSAIGPFWLTLSVAVTIGTIGFVFSQVFKSSLAEFLPFLATGLVLWNFISTTLNEGCSSFIAAEGIIKQLPVPLFTHVLRVLWRNAVMLAHNLVILPLVFLAVGKPLGWAALIGIPGLLLAIANLGWITLVLAVLCTRFRDLPQIVGSGLQVVFYLSPILWMPSLVPARATDVLLDFNPVHHVLELMRTPLLGHAPHPMSWAVCAAAAAGGWGVALLLYGRFKRRIAYWL
jgi:lipopolysaccharide transport system permease protein